MLTDHYWFNGRDGDVASQIDTITNAGIEDSETLWWDVEAEGTMPHWSPAEVVTFATALNDAGIPFARQGIYMSSSVTRNEDWSPVVALGLRLWVADYGLNNGTPSSVPLVGYWRAVDLWQYTSTAKLPGYDGNLDMSQSGEDVWTVYDLQVALNDIVDAGLEEDGIPGPATTEGIKKYQRFAELDDDGVAGSITLSDLANRLGK